MERPPCQSRSFLPSLPPSSPPRRSWCAAAASAAPMTETCEALFLTSGFVYGSAAEAEAAFKADGSRYVYSRYRNPTVTMFEERLRLIEGAEACRATASGMAAVFAALLCKLRAGTAAGGEPGIVRLLPLHRRRSVAAVRHRDRAGRRPRSVGVGSGAGGGRGSWPFARARRTRRWRSSTSQLSHG